MEQLIDFLFDIALLITLVGFIVLAIFIISLFIFGAFATL